MYGYIYLTTNLINNKKYIGQHKANQFDENYVGSGKLLKKAVSKYGKENFCVEMLAQADCKDILNQLEKEFISKYDAVNNVQFYNTALGGQGGNVNDWLPDESLTDWKNKNKILHEEKQKGVVMIDRVLDKAKYLENKELAHKYNKENPLVWCNNGEQNIYIRSSEPIPEGYIKGKLNPRKWFTNGFEEVYIDISKQIIPEGFYQGRAYKMSEDQKLEKSKRMSEYVWYTDGNKVIRINKNDAPPIGFIKGRLKFAKRKES